MKKTVLMLSAVCLLHANAGAMTDGEYKVNEQVVNASGGFQSDVNYSLLGSLGEPIIGSASDDVNWMISGFLQAMSVFQEDDIKAKLPAGRIAWAVNNKIDPTKGEKTIIQFRVGDRRKRVTIKIYSLLGEFIKTVTDSEYDPIASNTGNPLDDFWSVTWAGVNLRNAVVGSGIYLIVVNVGGEQQILKTAIIK